MTEPQRFILGLAYAAGRDEKITKGLDEARDYFTDVELEKAAWSYLPNGAEVGAFHLSDTLGHAVVVESYIYRGPDWQVGDTIIKAGDWLVGMILDDVAWSLAKAGKFTGLSPDGRGKRRKPSTA